MFHVSDTIIWGLCSTYNATIWNTRPLCFSVWLESLVLATIVSPQNSTSYLAALPHWKRKTIIIQRPNGPRQWGFMRGGLHRSGRPLTLLETEDYCEMTKQVILWSVVAFPVYVIAYRWGLGSEVARS